MTMTAFPPAQGGQAVLPPSGLWPWSQPSVVRVAGVTGGTAGSLQSAVREAALAASDFSWLSKGDTVFIKPAHNSGSPYPATTSPAAVAAMIVLLREKGAGRVVVGDMAGIEHVKLSPAGMRGSTRRLMEASGMAAAVRHAGGELHFFEEEGWGAFFEEGPLAGPHWRQGLMMPRILQRVDHLILMPRCGRHVLAGSTLGLKAAVGYWRTDTRLEYHRDAATLQEKTAEGNTVPTLLAKQRLVLSAADRMLATFGPDRGHVHRPDPGLVIASASVVAHDLVSLAWLLENRVRIPPGFWNGILDCSPLVARLANDWVVQRLGGWTPVLAAERLRKNDLRTLADDRVLNQACRISGGRPRVEVMAANDLIPADLRERLQASVAEPLPEEAAGTPDHGSGGSPPSWRVTQ